MRPLELLRIALPLALLLASAPNGAAQSAQLSERVSAEERIAAGSGPITAVEVKRAQALVADARASKDAALLTRAQLVLLLFQERESSKSKLAALNASIAAEADSLSAARRHEKRDRRIGTSFGVGVASLALIGISEGVSSWAVTQFQGAATASAAAPFYTAGKISQVTADIGIVGAIGGIGLSWLMEINPFDTFGAATVPSPFTSYPRAGMSVVQKRSYLEQTKVKLEREAVRSRSVRKSANGFFVVGIVSAALTGAASYLEGQAYDQYRQAIGTTSESSLRNTYTAYQGITLLLAGAAGVGLGGGAIGYSASPDPAEVDLSIRLLDAQLQLLSQGQ